MKKIKLYIAVSLDNKIAGRDGDVSWLDQWTTPEEDYGYSDFMKTVDTTLMGNKTYQQVLGFGTEFPYKDKINYVFTRNDELIADENVKFIARDHAEFVKKLKEGDGDIWLIGGGMINSFLLKQGLIDEMIVFIMPIILGEGIPLFENPDTEYKLELINSKTYNNGVVGLNYTIQNVLL